MTSVIIPEFVYDGIASAPAGQLMSGGFVSSGNSPSASAPAGINLVVFQKCSDNKEIRENSHGFHLII